MGDEETSGARLLGVTLEQYAGIQAAIAQGFPLAPALANERLSEARWARARAAWGSKLAREGHGGELSAAFRDKLAEADEWLGRRVAPLDEDLAAWLGFLGAYAAEPAPSTLLARLGMRDADVTRLVGLWKRRTDRDEALARKAVEINRTKPGAVPRVVVTEGKLRPFPWSPGPEKKDGSVPRPAPRALPLAPEPPIEAPVVAVETPSFLLPKATPAAPDVSAARAAPLPATPPPVAPLATGTALVFELPRAVLPFAEPSQSAASGLSTGTAFAFELPAGPVTPFAPKGPDRGEELAAAPEGPAAKPKQPMSTGTVLAESVPRGPELPFSGPTPGPDRPGDRTEDVDLAAIVSRVRAQRPPPALTLEQHASLCAELAFRPDRAAETLARYRVTEAQKGALDHLYSSPPDRKTVWDTAYHTYLRWLSSSGGNKA